MSDPTKVFVKTNLNIAAILIFILTLWCMNHSITGASAFKGDLEELVGSGDGIDNCIGKVCLNGGTCLDSSNNDDQDLYNERLPFCSCVSGYTGEDCGISDATTDITGKIGSETTTESKDTEVNESTLCLDKEIGIVIGAAGLCLLMIIIVLIIVVVLLCQRKRVQERKTEICTKAYDRLGFRITLTNLPIR
ncbi:uncharacterized protein [Ptychodera flava]|uniref:uncharacterized protein n=1 Tax=Ptychodera flava TaxID=63121 RepID=UPI00396A6EE7